LQDNSWNDGKPKVRASVRAATKAEIQEENSNAAQAIVDVSDNNTTTTQVVNPIEEC